MLAPLTLFNLATSALLMLLLFALFRLTPLLLFRLLSAALLGFEPFLLQRFEPLALLPLAALALLGRAAVALLPLLTCSLFGLPPELLLLLFLSAQRLGAPALFEFAERVGRRRQRLGQRVLRGMLCGRAAVRPELAGGLLRGVVARSVGAARRVLRPCELCHG